jgi:hypothetical protein
MGLHKIGGGGGGVHVDTLNVFAKATRTAINIHSSKVALGETETYMIHYHGLYNNAGSMHTIVLKCVQIN